MKKRLLSLLLVLVMVLTLVPVTGAETVTSGTCGANLTWTLDSEGTLTISGSGEMIPDPPWRSYKSKIIKLVIGEGVTSISDSAFSGYSGLEDVTIPATVTSIGTYAFAYCSSLEDVTIPASVTSIGGRAFANCPSLTTVTYMGTSEPTVGGGAFPKTGTQVNVPANYKEETFGGLSVNKAATTYTITIADGIENGTVEADKTTAAAGDTVTLTVTPDEGYELDTLKAGDSDVTTMNAYGQHTFTMPASDVTVTATFKQNAVSLEPYQVVVYNWDLEHRDMRWGPYTMQPMEGYDGIYYAEIKIEGGMENVGLEFINNAGGEKPGDRSLNAPGEGIRHTFVVWDVKKNNATAIHIAYPSVYTYRVANYLEMETATPDYGEEVVLKKKEGFPENARIVVNAVNGDIQIPIAVTEKDDQRVVFTCKELEYTQRDSENLLFDYLSEYYVSIEYKTSPEITGKGTVNVPEYVEQGSTFTIIATPDEGYVVDTITVTNKDGMEVEPNEDGTYTMYAGGVTVTATFKKAASGGDQGGGTGGSQLPSKPSYPTYWPIVDETTVGGAKAEDQFTVLCRKLNVRAGAGTQFEKIGSLHRGEVVKGKDLGNGWIEIEYEGRTAYISAQYVEMHSADCEKDVTVICRKLNVRTGAGTEYRKIGSVTRGEVLCVVSESNGWYEVLYQDGTAWICAKYAA